LRMTKASRAVASPRVEHRARIGAPPGEGRRQENGEVSEKSLRKQAGLMMVLGRAGPAVSRRLGPLVTESGSGTLQVDGGTVTCQVSK
jgi:hypothetical protein